MKDIPIKRAMMAWNPKICGGDGRIVIIDHPDCDHECDRLNLSDTTGACFSNWGGSTKRKLQLWLLIEGIHISIRDGLNIKVLFADWH